VHVAAIVNKVVDKRETVLPQRLRHIMEPQAFKELQKKYRRRYGGDVHCKKFAQNVLKGRILTNRTFTIPYRDGHVVEDILEFLSRNGRCPGNEDGVQVTIANICYKALVEMREKRQETHHGTAEFKRLVGADRRG
jgi:hypothetical protein